jgi:heme oxygenase
MEETLAACQDKRVTALDAPSLRRLEALEKDMEYFYGNDWKSCLETQSYHPTKATQQYMKRIQELSGDSDQAYLLIAHQYTRYLGDLFGGQMMGNMATRSMKLPDGKGVAFYKFDSISNTNEFITNWYTLLNSLELTEKQKSDIVDEANLVFDLNIGILNELDGSPLKALWMMTISSIKEKIFGKQYKK